MPWLTPDSIPEGDDCRPLSIPADSAWLALVSGALTELTLPYNWQKFGTLTVAETVAKMQEIVDNYYDTPCAACTIPGGYPVVRYSTTGHLQQLDGSGEWVDATGDYHIPPPEARTEGTPPDQNCLAAKNATNVLSQLYESLSESFSSELSTDEALVAFAAAAVAAVGFEFAPITFAIAGVAFAVFEVLFHALEYVTADLWTDDFDNQFACLLLNCAINTDGVVTFDWDCFNNALLAQADSMGLSEVQMRLYVQIGYILYFIGGADGLNLAARTTDITNDDCSFCPTPWAVEWIFADDSDLCGLTLNNGSYVGTAYQGDFISSSQTSLVEFQTDALPEFNITHLDFIYSMSDATNPNAQIRFRIFNGATLLQDYITSPPPTGSHLTFAWDGDLDITQLVIDCATGSAAGATAKIEQMHFSGIGTAPSIGQPC